MSHTRAISAQAVIATQGLEGYGVCQCVEMPFGATVRQKPGSDPPVQDATVTWVADGPVIIETSIDDGRTWAAVSASGGVIPQLPIGRSVTNVQLLVRARFFTEAVAGSGVPPDTGRLTSLTVTVVLEDGTTITRTETGATDLAKGEHYGTEVDATGAVRAAAQPYVALRGGYLRRDIAVAHSADASAPPSAGLACWLRADDLIGVVPHGQYVSRWVDASGNNRDLTQSNAAQQPTFRANIVQRHGVVRFVASRVDHMNFPTNAFTALTSGGEVFIVLKATAEPPGSVYHSGLWHLTAATSATHYTWPNDGVLYDGFGSTTRRGSAGGPNPDLSTTQWRLYNVRSVAGAWASRHDGVSLFSDAANTVGWPAAPRLGASLASDNEGLTNFSFDGDVAELLLYDHTLTDANRALVQEYLRKRFDLSVPAIDAEQVASDLHVSHGDLQIFQTTTSGGRITATRKLEVERGEDGAPASAISKRAFENASMAWEMWFAVDADAPQSEMVLIGWVDLQKRANDVGLLCSLVPSGDAFSLRHDCWEHSLFYDSQDTRYRLTSGATSIARGRWYHVAWSYDGLWSTLYLNTAVVGQLCLRSRNWGPGNRGKVMGIVVPTAGACALGAHPVTGAQRFLGRLNECRIYSRRLTAGEVVARSRRRVAGAEATAMAAAGLRAYYPLTTRAATIADESGHGLDVNVIDNVVAAGGTGGWIGIADHPAADTSDTVSFSPGRVSPPLDLGAVSSNVVRLTNAPFNVTFPDGRTFLGTGSMGTISAVQEPGDLTPSGMEFTLSGLPSSFVAIALGVDYQGRPCRVYHTQFNSAGAVIDAPWLVFAGLIDTLSVTVDDTTATVTVTAESHLRNWERPANVRWNHQTHLSEFPDDYGLELLAEAAEQEIWWPAKVSQEDDKPDPETQGDV
jgi:hypothetical protein